MGKNSLGSIKLWKEEVNKEIIDLELLEEVQQLSPTRTKRLKEHSKEIQEIYHKKETMWR